MQHLSTADRVHAILTDEHGPGGPGVHGVSKVLDELRENHDRTDAYEFGVLVGAAFALERIADPLAPHEDVVFAATEAAAEAWKRYTTVPSEVRS